MSSKIKGIPTVSAKAGLNLNTVSMTQTRKNNIGGESKIKGVPSVSVKADSNLNTVSMTPTLKLKYTKEVLLQLPGTSQQINGHFTSPRSARGCKNKQSLSVSPEKGNMEQEHIIVCQLQLVCVPIQPISPGRREDECHGRFRSPSDNYRASQDQDRQPVVHREIPSGYYSTRLQMPNILVHREKMIMDKAQGTLMARSFNFIWRTVKAHQKK